jgi:hypothetical protein
LILYILVPTIIYFLLYIYFFNYILFIQFYYKDNAVAGIMVTVLVLTRVTVLLSGLKPLKRGRPE